MKTKAQGTNIWDAGKACLKRENYNCKCLNLKRRKNKDQSRNEYKGGKNTENH